LGWLDDERGGDRANIAQTPVGGRGGRGECTGPPARADRQSLHRCQRPYGGDDGAHSGIYEGTAQPARIPTADRVSRRTAQDPGGEDQPQSPARAQPYTLILSERESRQKARRRSTHGRGDTP